MDPVNVLAKFEVEIMGGTHKIWTVPGYAHANFSAKFLMGCCSDAPLE